MKPLPRVPGMRVMCPENCRYRSKLAPFCGYCMMEILKKPEDKEEDDGNRQSETEDVGQAEG